MKKTIYIFIISIVANFCFAQKSINEVDSLVKITVPKSATVGKIEMYNKICNGYINFDLTKAKQFNDSVFVLSIKKHYKRGEYLFLNNKAYLLLLSGKKVTALNIALKANTYFKSSKDTIKILDNTWLLSNIYSSLNKADEAKKLILEELNNLNTNSDYNDLKGELFQTLATLYSDNENYKAIYYLQKAIDIFRKFNTNIYGINNCYLTLVNIYCTEGQYEMALHYFKLIDERVYKKPLYVYETYLRFSSQIGFGTHNYAKSIEQANKALQICIQLSKLNGAKSCLNLIAKSYNAQKKCKLAIAISKKCLTDYPSSNEDWDAFQNLGKSFFALKNYEQAKYYQIKALNTKAALFNISIYDDLSKTEFELGNYRNATLYNIKYKDKKLESLMNDKTNRIAELQFRFGLKEKNLLINEINLKNKVKTIELKSQRKYNLFLQIIIFTVIVVLLFLFFVLLSNKKKKTILENQNTTILEKIEELELAKSMISKSLIEKEILLREIHHRVKNNLQMVMSLLTIQAEESQQITIEEFIEKSQSRISSMALIHQNLYLFDDFNKINFQNYLEELIQNISSSFNNYNEHIQFNVNATECFFNIQTAIPLGLIVNEIITNSLKHAFPNGNEGLISICLKKTETNKFRLQLRDDGIGIASKTKSTNSIGLELVDLLVSQLNGTVLLESLQGTIFTIHFEETKI